MIKTESRFDHRQVGAEPVMVYIYVEDGEIRVESDWPNLVQVVLLDMDTPQEKDLTVTLADDELQASCV